MLSAETIKARLRDQPFIPVRFVMSSDQNYDVYHPDMVMVGRGFLIIGLPRSDNPSEPEQVTRVGILHVTEMKDLPRPTSQANSPSA